LIRAEVDLLALIMPELDFEMSDLSSPPLF